MVSEKHKCIFVHIPKTGGQSIEQTFVEMDHVEKKDLLIKENDDPSLGPPYLMHLMADEYVSKGYIDKSKFFSFFKFAFVRNPWSRMVSFYKFYSYCWRYDFKTYLLKYFEKKDWQKRYWCFAPQYDFIFDKKGNRLVDFVGKFENLENDFQKVCQEIDIDPGGLKHVNKSRPSDLIPLKLSKQLPINTARNIIRLVYWGRIRANLHTDYRDYYDDETIEFVRNKYRKDVEYFNYSFGL